MKPFESFLAQKINDYIAYRQSLSFSEGSLKTHLKRFDRYLKMTVPVETVLPPSFFLEFRKSLTVNPSTANTILGTVRGFFQFMVRNNDYPENPMQNIPGFKEDAYIPFVFSFNQIDCLLKLICKKIRKTDTFYLKDFSVYMAVLLMARCGLRISEPLSLKQNHYRLDEGTLYIEKTKFNKDRLIPLPKTVCQEIDNYLLVRNKLLGNLHNPYLLSGEKVKKLSKNRIYTAFHGAVKEIGIVHPRRKIGSTIYGPPRVHCLRHSFVINTLKQIKLRKESPQKALPYLAAYLGHRKYRYTALYLKVLDAEKRQELVDFNIRIQESIK